MKQRIADTSTCSRALHCATPPPPPPSIGRPHENTSISGNTAALCAAHAAHGSNALATLRPLPRTRFPPISLFSLEHIHLHAWVSVAPGRVESTSRSPVGFQPSPGAHESPRLATFRDSSTSPCVLVVLSVERMAQAVARSSVPPLTTLDFPHVVLVVMPRDPSGALPGPLSWQPVGAALLFLLPPSAASSHRAERCGLGRGHLLGALGRRRVEAVVALAGRLVDGCREV